MDKLDEIFLRQQALDEFIIQNHPEKADQHTFLVKMFSVIEEIVEVGKEVNWKPWKQDKEINKTNLYEEVVDVFHFVVSLAIKAGLTPGLLYNIYVRKNCENFERQLGKVEGREDYAGVK